MTVAPNGWTIAPWKHAVAVSQIKRLASRGLDGSARPGDLALELSGADHPGDGRVAREPARRLGRHGSTILELGRRCAGGPGEGVDAGLDDQEGPHIGAPTSRFAAGCLFNQFHQTIGAALSQRPIVVFTRRGLPIDGPAQNRSGLAVEETVDPHQPTDRVTDVEVAALVRPIRFVQRRLLINPVFKVLGEPDQLSWIHGLGRFQERSLDLPDLVGADMVRSARQDGHLLIADLAPPEGVLGLGQLVELPCHGQPLGRGATRELALPPHPVQRPKGSILGVLTRGVEAAQPIGKSCLERVDAGLTNLDEGLTQDGSFRLGHQPSHLLIGRPQPAGCRHDIVDSRPAVEDNGSHAAIVRHGYDSCLSKTAGAPNFVRQSRVCNKNA